MPGDRRGNDRKSAGDAPPVRGDQARLSLSRARLGFAVVAGAGLVLFIGARAVTPVLTAGARRAAATAHPAASRVPVAPAGASRGAPLLQSPGPASSPAALDPMDPLLRQAIGFYTGSSGRVDDPRAHDLLLEAAADGDALSQMWLARCLSRGRMRFEQDEGRAADLAGGVIDEVIRLARADHPEAGFLLATAYAEGLGVEPDQELAMSWYFRSAQLGNILAQHNLGNAYREGTGAPHDPEIAAFWYRLSARQGDALTAFWLGQMYERGEGVARDPEEALRWYRDSAGRGNAQAKEALARLGGGG